MWEVHRGTPLHRQMLAGLRGAMRAVVEGLVAEVVEVGLEGGAEVASYAEKTVTGRMVSHIFRAYA